MMKSECNTYNISWECEQVDTLLPIIHPNRALRNSWPMHVIVVLGPVLVITVLISSQPINTQSDRLILRLRTISSMIKMLLQ